MKLTHAEAQRVSMEVIAEAARTLAHGDERHGFDIAGVLWFLEDPDSPFTAMASGAGLDYAEILEAHRERREEARAWLAEAAAAREREGRDPRVFEPERLPDVVRETPEDRL